MINFANEKINGMSETYNHIEEQGGLMACESSSWGGSVNSLMPKG